MRINKPVAILVLLIGLCLIIAGITIKIPGTYLTTYQNLDGHEKYTAIEEYVGGDAYNYIIGASLVGGRIAGMLTMKAIFIGIGIVVVCIGLICCSVQCSEQSTCQKETQAYLKEAPDRISE